MVIKVEYDTRLHKLILTIKKDRSAGDRTVKATK